MFSKHRLFKFYDRGSHDALDHTEGTPRVLFVTIELEQAPWSLYSVAHCCNLLYTNYSNTIHESVAAFRCGSLCIPSF